MFNFKKLVEKFKGKKEVEQPVVLEVKQIEEQKPYKNIYFAGECITVVMYNGGVLMTSKGNKDLYDSLINAKTENEVVLLMTDNYTHPTPVTESHDTDEEEDEVIVKQISMELEEEEEVEEEEETEGEKEIKEAIESVVKSKEVVKEKSKKDTKNLPSDLISKDGKVYMKGIDLEIPGVIVGAMVDAYKTDKYEPLKKFWLRLCLNPLEQSRNDIYNFIRKNNVKITNNGLLVLYRRVVSNNETSPNKKLIEFVSTEYAKIKLYKKSPKKYEVYSDGTEYIAIPLDKKKNPKFNKLEGNLADLYVNLKDIEGNVYTAYHDPTVLIKIGDVYKIPDDKINLNNGICAAGGLHAASRNYDYSGFGDTPVMVLVNPSKAITVPKNDFGKLRTTEMFIVGVLKFQNGKYMDDGIDIAAFDEEYAQITLQELEAAAKAKKFTKDLVIKSKEPEIKVSQLDLIKESLKKRIVKV